MNPYPLSADQLRDVTSIVKALDGVEKEMAIHDEEGKIGNGFRAILRGPIPVFTDARGESEILGWIKYDDHNWAFSQINVTTGVISAEAIRSGKI